MTRVLSVVAFLVAALATPCGGAPADAATVSVTIHASKTTLLDGSSTVISGTAVKAEPGSVVQLQHRSGGSWAKVRSAKIAADRAYAFTITPRRGWQSYRVVKPRQLGQAAAASSRLTLRVQWIPSITFTTQTKILDGTQWAVIRGSVTDAPDSLSTSYVHLQERQANGTWRRGSTYFEWTDSSRTEFQGTASLADGEVYRLSLDATDLTRPTHSQPATFHREPYTMSVNSGIHLAGLESRAGAATIELDLDSGQVVTLAGSDGRWVLHLLGPTGSEVGQVASEQRFGRFRTPASGRYQIVVDNLDNPSGYQMDIWASEPLVQDVRLGEPAHPVTLLPRQELDLRFSVPADHAVTIETNTPDPWTTDDSVVDAAGTAVAPVLPASGSGSQSLDHSPVFYSPTGETLTYRYRPDSAHSELPYQPTVYDAPIQDLEVDAAPLSIDPTPQGAVALVRYAESVGWPPTLSTNAARAERYGPVTEWGGAHAIVVHDQLATTSVQLLSPLEFDYRLDDPELTVDTTAWFARELILHVALKAGDVVSGTGSVWPEGSGTLLGPTGEPVPGVGNYASAFIAPTDGVYTYHVISQQQVEKIGVARDSEVPFPADSPTRFSIDAPDHVAYAWVTAPPGATVSVDALAADPGLGDVWTVGISDPPGGLLARVTSGKSSASFVVGSSGRYLVLVDATGDKTGSVTLEQHVVSSP